MTDFQALPVNVKQSFRAIAHEPAMRGFIEFIKEKYSNSVNDAVNMNMDAGPYTVAKRLGYIEAFKDIADMINQSMESTALDELGQDSNKETP